MVQAEEVSLLSGQFLKPAFQQNSRDEKVGERSHQQERRIGEPRHRAEKEDKHPKVVPLEAVEHVIGVGNAVAKLVLFSDIACK